MRLAILLVLVAGCDKLFGIHKIPYAGDAALPYFDAPVDAPPAASLQLDNTSYDFGMVVTGHQSFATSISVVNVGNAPTGAMTIMTSDATPADYTITNDGCTANVLAPGHGCVFSIAFAPSHTGTRDASLVAGDGTASVMASLTGVGLPPGALDISQDPTDFGIQTVQGSATAKTMTLKNTGSNPLTLTAIGLSGAQQSDYTIVTNTGCQVGTLLAPSAMCTLDMHFTPSLGGSRLASLNVMTDATTNALSSASLGGTGRATVAVSKLGTGGGTIMSSDTAMSINCGGACTASFTTAQVVLSATPDGQSAFGGWSSNCGTGLGPCTLATNQPSFAVTGTFAPYSTLTVRVTGTAGLVTGPGINCTNAGGSGCVVTVAPGTNIPLVPADQGSSVFSVWKDACQYQNSPVVTYSPDCFVTVNGDTTVTADFASDHVLNLVPHLSNATQTTGTPKAHVDVNSSLVCQDDGQVCSFHFTTPPQVVLSLSGDVCAVPGAWAGNDPCLGQQPAFCHFSWPASDQIVTVEFQFNTNNGGNCPLAK